MPDLSFALEGVQAVAHAASPTLALSLRITCSGKARAPIHSVMLRGQLHIAAKERAYDDLERKRLADVFGAGKDFARGLRWLLWTHVTVTVPPFVESVLVDVPVACSFDVGVASTKYFEALGSGDVPITMALGGTVFHEGEGGSLQVAQIPREAEVQGSIPVAVWQAMMGRHYPHGPVLEVGRGTFGRLQDYKAAHGLATWDQVLDSLLALGRADR